MVTDEPSFLNTQPASLPDPAARPTVVLAPSPAPYRTPGLVQPVRPPPRVTPARPAPAPPPDAVASVGDQAGEHLEMSRGRYRAWTHVVIAFGLESALLGALPILILHATLGRVVADSAIPTGLGFVVGAVLAWRIFRDRWRCIEAYSSQFCSGLMNLSVLYVPFIALIYANVRGLAKLKDRRALG